MRKYFGVAAMVVFLLAFALAIWPGGRDMLESPLSSIPSLLIDHNDNETEIYVHGLSDFRFTNMSIHVSGDSAEYERFKEDAYFVYFNTSLQNFTFNVTVWNRHKHYYFNGSIEVAPPEAAPRIFTLFEEKKDRINIITLNSGNLPWKKLMERR